MTTLEKIKAELQRRYWKTNQGKPSKRNGYNNAIDDALQIIDKYAEQEPCDDAISREELLKAIDTWDKFGCDADTKLVPYQDHYIPYIHYDDVVKCIKAMPSVRPQEPNSDIPLNRVKNELTRVKNELEPKTEQFAEWVAREIFDDTWEYNKDAFVEIACRKLAKLGIVREKGDEWELVEPQEGSE